ncbi:hypothetical protein ACCAA_270125 [Candidatus Accumulibacter aalborgensis]|uniref:Uncharacterized protein n=1 Tax=Candidatus Accumulibacter aalborgensis TaxID=1860102 RepID=A0A1A8XPN1_9PROT|nr:hypothetical protein ACCAA_270125 [Candidatus Accumulibacter aalborgensis]
MDLDTDFAVRLWVVMCGGIGMRRDIYLSGRDRVMVRAMAVEVAVRQRACQHVGARFIGR